MSDTTTTDEAPATEAPDGATQETSNPQGVQPTDAPETSPDETEPDTFPRQVVEELRRENAKYRQRAGQVDDLARRLHTELVRATGRLADPTDLPFDAAHLDDPDALAAAIADLLDRKPHLASRRPAGDIGQGARGTAAQPFSLLDALKQRA